MSNAPAAPQMVRRDDRAARGPGRVVKRNRRGAGTRARCGRPQTRRRARNTTRTQLGATRRRGSRLPRHGGGDVTRRYVARRRTPATQNTLKDTSNWQLTLTGRCSATVQRGDRTSNARTEYPLHVLCPRIFCPTRKCLRGERGAGSCRCYASAIRFDSMNSLVFV
ncbi:hypothetical protein EVAR_38896_1 [Eumeta japonica]|uniref:Uncharacterized protein n=1 Tax=Eumeta variegata TaxID=151549 RepID=A0A4C1ZQ18_EUMVA|nr:hypothetical protein EVAR_38896_1 [Eumeta japonica]